MCACPCGAILAEVLNSSYVVLTLLYVIMSVTIKYLDLPQSVWEAE